MYLDCHVHCRDFEQKSKETVTHALEVAKDSGLSGIFDMPNTVPLITTRQKVLERFAIAENANSPVFYGLYIGLTSHPDQIREAVETYKEFCYKNLGYNNRSVVGLKMFAGKSVGDLTISNSEVQLEVYNQLYNLGYEGTLVVHCEKESEMYPELWDSSRPRSHCEARPESSELESVRDQIYFTIKSNYGKRGKLHIAHVSTPQTVDLINSSRTEINISCGATPHHLLLNNEIMKFKDGILYKVNPPLRNKKTQERLLEKFRKGLIDTLESDHAPHTREEKIKDHMSGIPQLASWPVFVKLLKQKGIDKSLIDRVTFENVNNIFGTKIKKLDFPIKSHIGEYAFDPFENLK